MFSQLLLDCMGVWNSISKDFKINVAMGVLWRTAEPSLQLPFLPAADYGSVSVIRYLFCMLTSFTLNPESPSPSEKVLHFFKNVCIYMCVYICMCLYTHTFPRPHLIMFDSK